MDICAKFEEIPSRLSGDIAFTRTDPDGERTTPYASGRGCRRHWRHERKEEDENATVHLLFRRRCPRPPSRHVNHDSRIFRNVTTSEWIPSICHFISEGLFDHLGDLQHKEGRGFPGASPLGPHCVGSIIKFLNVSLLSPTSALFLSRLETSFWGWWVAALAKTWRVLILNGPIKYQFFSYQVLWCSKYSSWGKLYVAGITVLASFSVEKLYSTSKQFFWHRINKPNLVGPNCLVSEKINVIDR